jgi:hypothetical protein
LLDVDKKRQKRKEKASGVLGRARVACLVLILLYLVLSWLWFWSFYLYYLVTYFSCLGLNIKVDKHIELILTRTHQARNGRLWRSKVTYPPSQDKTGQERQKNVRQDTRRQNKTQDKGKKVKPIRQSKVTHLDLKIRYEKTETSTLIWQSLIRILTLFKISISTF